MMYWLFLPLIFSVGLLTYVYAIDPRERSNRPLALLMLCTALRAAASFILATTEVAAIARWSSALGSMLGFSATGLLFWFLALELVEAERDRPAWIRGYTVFSLLVSLASAFVILLDHLQLTSIFYGPLQYVSGVGYVPTAGRWAIGREVFRLVPMWGALGILIWHWRQADKRWRAFLSPALIALLAVPVMNWYWQINVGSLFPGIDLVADFLLVLALGYAAVRLLLAPIAIVLRRVIDSMADGVIVLDGSGRVLRMNDIAGKLLDVAASEVVGRLCQDLFVLWRGQIDHPEPLDELLARLQAKSEQAQTIEVEVRNGGTCRHVRLQTSPVYSHRPAVSDVERPVIGHLILLADLTDVHNRQEALEKALTAQSQRAAALTRLSSPILPVAEHTIVMPLVGNLDVDRITQVSKVLLDGVKAQRARMTIVDLTGVQQITDDAADMFVKLVDATCLLGTELILVGVRPQVAEMLSDLDMDIRLLTVQSDLRAGLQYAVQALSSSVR